MVTCLCPYELLQTIILRLVLGVFNSEMSPFVAWNHESPIVNVELGCKAVYLYVKFELHYDPTE